MGETLYKKISFINIICKLYEYKLITKNIKVSITDNDLVAFINKNN